MILLQQTIQYVISAPYFLESMTMVTLCAMFIGATIYNGDTNKLAKWLVTTVPYMLLLIATNLMRIHSGEITNEVQAYAGSISILIVSFFYFFGMMISVGLLSIFIGKKHWAANKESLLVK